MTGCALKLYQDQGRNFVIFVARENAMLKFFS